AHADEIGGVVGANLRKVLDWLPQAREILRVKCDVPLPVKLEDLACCEPDNARLLELFDRLELKALKREIAESATAAAAASPARNPSQAAAPKHEVLASAERLDALLERILGAEQAALHLTSIGTDPMQARLVGIGVALDVDDAAYIALAHRHPGEESRLDGAQALARLRPWLEDDAPRKIIHDAKAAMHLLANQGIAL